MTVPTESKEWRACVRAFPGKERRFPPSFMLGGSFPPVRSQIRSKVRTHGTAPRHLQRPGRDFIGNILRSGEGGLIDTIVTPPDVNVALGHAQLPRTRGRERQLGKISSVGK